MGSIGLKSFGVGSMGGVGPKILAWVTWVKHLAWVAWVPKILAPGSKSGVGQKNNVGSNVLLINHTL